MITGIVDIDVVRGVVEVRIETGGLALGRGLALGQGTGPNASPHGLRSDVPHRIPGEI